MFSICVAELRASEKKIYPNLACPKPLNLMLNNERHPEFRAVGEIKV
jgi:hypothetical protein